MYNQTPIYQFASSQPTLVGLPATDVWNAIQVATAREGPRVSCEKAGNTARQQPMKSQIEAPLPPHSYLIGSW